ncbi:MAG: AMP-binding protein [Bacteroidales bacterium]|nr:AMP-binding protein [Bacteroidales bacterium]
MESTSLDVQKFFDLREFVLKAKNYDEAYQGFKWPRINKFNWASDYFDKIAKGNTKPALIYADTEGNEITVSYDEMMKRSNQVANFLSDLGMQKGDRVLIMMDTSVEIFELFLGIMKMGGSIIPASTLLSPADISDRIERGNVKFVIVHNKFRERVDQAGEILKSLKALVCVRQIAHKCDCEDKELIPCWTDYEESKNYPQEHEASFITYSTDNLFLFFTSGTTSQPKLVMHPYHYSVGHLTTMYWLDLKEDDVHYNISSPGWAKFAWSSFLAPWNAGATIFTFNYAAFDPDKTLDFIEKYKITSLCAPLSVWKLFVLRDFSKYQFNLKKIVSAGEPLNPEISKKVEELTGLQLREGYGQTETTGLIFTPRGMKVPEGSMGKVSPGYEIQILDEKLDEVKAGEDGQIAVATYPVKPLGLLTGYDDPDKNKEIFKGGWYLTGDTAYMDKEGFIHFIGRVDDVFKSLDYRISPFEVESEIMEHQAVMEVGVIPTVDDRDRIVPKAFIVLKPDFFANKQTALDLFRFIRDNMAPYKRPRSIEFMDEFPKTISAKVMRKDLRQYDKELKEKGIRGKHEFLEKDFAKELNLRKRT